MNEVRPLRPRSWGEREGTRAKRGEGEVGQIGAKRTERSRDLRHESSRAERVCWEMLRAKRTAGVKFRRQHPIGPYFADFACVSRRLVIEIDGEQHAYQVDADARRTAVLEQAGWRVVRFWANEVVANPEGVWTEIENLLRNG